MCVTLSTNKTFWKTRKTTSEQTYFIIHTCVRLKIRKHFIFNVQSWTFVFTIGISIINGCKLSVPLNLINIGISIFWGICYLHTNWILYDWYIVWHNIAEDGLIWLPRIYNYPVSSLRTGIWEMIEWLC